MTDLIDSGEIPRYDSLGVEPTEDLRHHLNRRDTTGELTRNLAHEIAGLPPRRRPASDETAEIRLVDVPLGLSFGDLAAIPREVDDTVLFLIPEPDDLAGPQSPPRPLPHPGPPPKPSYDMAAAQPIAPWERVVDTERLSLLGTMAGLDGELRPASFPTPVGAMVARKPLSWWARLTYQGKHRGGVR